MNVIYHLGILVFLGMFYVWRWGASSLPRKTWVQAAHALLIVVLFYSYLLTTRLILKNQLFWLDNLGYFTSILFGLAFYLTLGFLLLDLTRFIVRMGAWRIMSLDGVVEQFRLHGAGSVWIIAILVTGYGVWSARHPEIHNYDIQIADPLQPLKIAFVADVHVGIEMRGERLTDMVNRINALSPDIILLGGDIVDATPEYITATHALEPLRHLNAPLGVYAVTGNHEYYQGVDASIRLLQDVGINVLSDEAHVFPGNFILVGREDVTRTSIFGGKRVPISVILDKTPQNLPIILMDHQPIEAYIHEAENAGVDLQLSGHTHGGQIWPINYLMLALYGDTGHTLHANGLNLIITSGYGTVSPAIRVDATPEIVFVNLRGTTAPAPPPQQLEGPPAAPPSTAAREKRGSVSSLAPVAFWKMR